MDMTSFVMKTIRQKHKNDLKYLETKGMTLLDEHRDKLSYENRIEESLVNHLFMITVTYERSCLCVGSNLNNHIARINDIYIRLHNKISQDLIDGNISRKKHLQPYTWVFVDGATTRSGGNYSNSRAGENTHHHGIMLFHPNIVDNFKWMATEWQIRQWAKHTKFVANIKIEPLTNIEESFTATNYSHKLAGQLCNSLQIDTDLYFLLPHAKLG